MPNRQRKEENRRINILMKCNYSAKQQQQQQTPLTTIYHIILSIPCIIDELNDSKYCQVPISMQSINKLVRPKLEIPSLEKNRKKKLVRGIIS